MVKMGSVDTTYPYHIICNIDGIAVCAARAEFYTETGYGDSVGCYGHEYFRRTD